MLLFIPPSSPFLFPFFQVLIHTPLQPLLCLLITVSNPPLLLLALLQNVLQTPVSSCFHSTSTALSSSHFLFIVFIFCISMSTRTILCCVKEASQGTALNRPYTCRPGLSDLRKRVGLEAACMCIYARPSILGLMTSRMASVLPPLVSLRSPCYFFRSYFLTVSFHLLL